MPPGYSARCAACSSPHRSDIDRRLLSGESTRAVSAWLSTQGESISYRSLHRHRHEHLAVAEDVARLAAEAAPHYDAAVQQGLDHIAMLQRQAAEAEDLRALMAGLVHRSADNGKAPPLAAVQMWKASADELRQSSKAVRDILDARPEDEGRDTHDELSAWLAALAPTGEAGGGPAEPVP